jgi:PAS domain S-box-containing protein
LERNSEHSFQSRVSICTHYLNAFSNLDDVNVLVYEVEKALGELFPMEYSGLYLYNENKDKLELLIAHGFSEEERLEAERTAMERHPGMVFRTGEAIYIADTEDDTQPFSLDSKRSFKVRCRLFIPIRAFGKIIGTFGIVSSKVDAFSDEDKELFRFICELAGQVYTRIRIEEQKMEALLIQRKFSVIATNTDNAVVITCPDGKIEWINDAFTRITGYVLADVIGKVPGSFLQGKDTDRTVTKILGESIRKKEKAEGTLINYTKSGQPYIVYLQIYPVFDEHGQHTNFIALQKDVTKQEQARKEISDQRARLSAIVTTIPDQLFIVNGEGTIEEIFVNRPDQLPYSTEQLLGANLIHFESTDWGPSIKRALPLVLAGKKVDPIEGSANQNGQLRYYEIRLSKLDEQRILAVVRDTTSSRLTQMERDRQTRFYQLISDLSTRLISAEKVNLNDSMLEFIGKIGSFFELDKSSIVPFEMPDSIGVDPITWEKDSNAKVSSIWEHTTKADYPWMVEQLTNRHSLYIPVVSEMPEEAERERRRLAENQIQSLVVLPLVMNNNVLGIYTAKTKRVRKWSESEISLFKLAGDLVNNAYSRRAWEQERERFRTIFENAAFGALIFGTDGRIRYANRYVCDLLLSTSNEMHMQHFDSIFPTEFESNQEANIEKVTVKGIQESFELRLRLPDNKTKTVLSNAIYIEEAGGGDGLIAYTFSDISERILQEQATRNALNIVSEQNKRLLNFSYIVSHNIRSHASNISGIAHVLVDEPEPEIQRQFIEGLLKSSKNLDSTLRHLNELLNIQSRVNIHKEPLSFFQVVNRTLDTLVVDLKTNNVKIVNKIPDGFKLKTDNAYLDSIVLNLVSNAIKYRKTEEDPDICIEAGKRNSVPYFSIQDNGKGIDLEKHGDKIFGMFKTFHGNRDARGIGLFITRNQIEALGGTIEVESKVGEGTKFTVYLP